MSALAEGAFSEDHYASAYPPGIEYHFWNLARNRIIAAALRRQGVSGRLLEIGCGPGVVVAGLRAQGFDCWGSDISLSRPTPGAEGFLYLGQDCLALDAAFRESVETVLLLDVIEHVKNPVAFMASIRTGFPRARTLVVAVPAGQELWSVYDDTYGHLRRYDPAMTGRELSAAGFKVVRLQYFFHALYPVMRMMTRSSGDRKRQIIAPQGWKRIVHGLIATAFVLEARLLPARLVGTSLLAVAAVDEAAA